MPLVVILKPIPVDVSHRKKSPQKIGWQYHPTRT